MDRYKKNEKLNIIEIAANPILTIASSLPTISFHGENGEVFASIEVNKDGKLEVQTKIDFSEAGKQSAKVFWDAFSHYLKEEWDKWQKQTLSNT